MNGTVVRRVSAALLGLAVAGCSGDKASAKQTATVQPAAHKTETSAAGQLDLGGNSYRPGGLTAVGAVSGTIKLEGIAPVDSTPITADQKICGNVVPPLVDPTAKGLPNTVVWIADVKTGKALPTENRIFLSSEDCVLDPRAQATVVGATVNVTNDDKLIHKLVFTRAATGDTLAVMPFFNDGQVVATERLAAKPGIVAVRCTLHPWTHAYLAVFDHPYFAVTENDGSFKIDSLPPGTYRMMVWHEGATKPLERQITIAAGGTAKVDLAMALAARH